MVRIKHRYLLVNILYPESPYSLPDSSKPTSSILTFHAPTPSDLTPQLLLRAIRDQIQLLYGDYGVGVTGAGGGLSVKYLSPTTSTFILRSPRAHYRLVWAALTLTTHLPTTSTREVQKTTPQGRECVMRVVRVSGTIRKVEEEAIRRARRDILRARREEGAGEAMMTGAEEVLLGDMVGEVGSVGVGRVVGAKEEESGKESEGDSEGS